MICMYIIPPFLGDFKAHKKILPVLYKKRGGFLERIFEKILDKSAQMCYNSIMTLILMRYSP